MATSINRFLLCSSTTCTPVAVVSAAKALGIDSQGTMFSGTRVLCIRTPRRVPWYLHIISCTPHSTSDPFFTHPSASCPLDFCYQTGPRFEHWGLIKCLHLPRSGSLSLLLLALALASFRSRGKKARKKAKNQPWVCSFALWCFRRVSLFTYSSVYLPHMLRLSSS